MSIAQGVAPTPKAQASASSAQSKRSDSPGARLYYEHRRLKRDAMRVVLEEDKRKFETAHPFRPQIKDFPVPSRQPNENTFERLNQRKEEAAKIMAIRQLVQEKTMKECSFRPKINSSSETKGAFNAATVERLYRGAPSPSQRQRQHQIEQQEAELEQDGQFFHPQINALSRVTADADSYVPIHERINTLQREKEEHLYRLRMAEKAKADATFRPNINPTSKQMAELAKYQQVLEDGTVQDENVESRLSRPLPSKPVEDPLVEECTFRPKLSQKSVELTRQHAAFSSKDFAERQMAFARTSQNKLNQMRQMMERQEEATFHPMITPTSQILALAKRETEGKTTDRLYLRDRERNAELHTSLQDQYYSQFTFQPEISRISRVIAKPTRDLSVAKPRVNEELLERLEEEFRQKCTFQPQIKRASSAHVNGSSEGDSSLVNSNELVAEKYRRLEEMRKQQQYEELRSCTFKPEAGKPAPSFDRHVEVAGISRHLERQETAKKLQEEKRQREENCFRVANAHLNEGHKYTIPQPFSFTIDSHAQARRKRIEELLQKEREKVCPFKPETNPWRQKPKNGISKTESPSNPVLLEHDVVVEDLIDLSENT